MSKGKKIWSIVSTVLVALLAVVALLLIVARFAGFEVYTVISGSMRPEYKEGDLIFVQKTDPEGVQVGDVITFVLNEDKVVATHRVVEVDAQNHHFYTKGDANDTPDGTPVHFKNLIGIPRIRVPLLGYVSSFIQTPPGSYITLALCVALIVAVFLPDFIGKGKRKKSFSTSESEQGSLPDSDHNQNNTPDLGEKE